ncbi:MAG: SseB family protein [Chloroflexi bacterium]|nr:MAG: SseB family protein [Chloroflexota bacterium]
MPGAHRCGTGQARHGGRRMSEEWPAEAGVNRDPDEPQDASQRSEGGGEAAYGGGATALLERELLIPIRSSSGDVPDAERITIESLRHGTDQQGRFLAAFTDREALSVLGPPGSDAIALTGRELFERAERADERVVVNPGSPDQVEVPAGVLPFLLAGIDLTTPDALRARRPLGGLPPLEVPASIPEPFGAEMRAALAELPAVERAWLLRVGTAWTVGVQLDPRAPLAEFDAVRNRLHALASEHLGSRRDLIVTDLRSPTLRAHYEAAAPPFYVPAAPRSFFTRLFDRG